MYTYDAIWREFMINIAAQPSWNLCLTVSVAKFSDDICRRTVHKMKPARAIIRLGLVHNGSFQVLQ